MIFHYLQVSSRLLRSICMVLGLAMVAHAAGAQDSLVLNTRIPSPWPNPVPVMEDSSVVIPFKRVGNLIILEAVIDSMIGNFILDTGAPDLVLNKTYFRNVKLHPDLSASGVTGNSLPVYSTYVELFRIPGIRYERLDARVTELGSIENKKGIKILGLLGVGLFTEFEMEIDLRRNTLTLYRLDRRGNCLKNEANPLKCYQYPVNCRMEGNALFLEGNIQNRRALFCLDSGAEISLIESRLNKKTLASVSITGRQILRGVNGNPVEVLSATLPSLTVGAKTYKDFPVLLTNLSRMGQGYGQEIDGMLGFDFFEGYRVRINWRKGKLYLQDYETQTQ